MPPAKSSKTGKASKAAEAILHPRSTLAAAKAEHSRPSSAESTSASQARAAVPSKSPASSIRKAPSNASISSNSAKPLPSAPSSTGSPASTIASLPSAPPAPSVLAPAINTDILSLKKGAMDRMSPAATATTSSSPTAQQSNILASPTAKAGDPPISSAAAPYSIGDGSARAAAASQPAAVDTVSGVPKMDTIQDNEAFPFEVAAVLTDSKPAPNEELLPATMAAPTALTQAIVDKASEADQAASSSSQPAASSASLNEAPLPAKEVSTTAVAAAKVATFTPPELTRLQHNTFVSRPTDASRASLRSVDASSFPAPLRPMDRQNGLVRSPSHVVIFGWMDAPIRLVAKYAQPYTVLFPDATVLIQLSDGKSYLAREGVRREQLQRVIAEISSAATIGADGSATSKMIGSKDVGDSTITLIDHSEARSASSSEDGKEKAPQMGGFVIHSFSDGGAGNLALFLDEMVRRKGASPRVHSLIMDSSPGKSNPKSGSVAFTMHLANRPRLRAIVRFFVYMGLYLLKIWTKVTGQPGRGELMRKRLNSLRSWSWVTASYTPREQAGAIDKTATSEVEYPPRMYMYTKADRLIPWQFVEEHAHELAGMRNTEPHLVQMENEKERETLLSAVKEQAAQSQDARAEYKVELRRWDSPPHCSIGRSDFEGYWAAVMDFYKNVLSRE